MYLIDQQTKAIMEECKQKARAAGLQFSNETLEYIVTNRDLIHLSPRFMIPTLYDYWVHDVEVLQGEGRYKLYPFNPYETVINSRPPISFYNDNNPDWLNIMIFYHVLAHIDFFQNNIHFQHTWNDDFVAIALADKRTIASFRTKYGRWTDYVIEFSRSLDNITGYFNLLARQHTLPDKDTDQKINFFFNTFLQDIKKENQLDIFKIKDEFNLLMEKHGDAAVKIFFNELRHRYPEFETIYQQYAEPISSTDDVLMFIRDHSPFLKKDENKWMKQIITIIRNTALYFAPQIRTKIMNEGWASYWHEKLYIQDERIQGHESEYARVNAGVTSLNRIGLNPYAIGMRLFEYIYELGEKGKLSIEYQRTTNAEAREQFDRKTGKGLDTIFEVRRIFSDFTFINTFIDQDFVNKYNLFVVGKRWNEQLNVIEYYIKSKKSSDYKLMLLNNLYHPPLIRVNTEKTSEKNLYLEHVFEGKQLVQEFIPDVLIGIEFLWGGQVQLETTQLIPQKTSSSENISIQKRRVLYTCQNRKIELKEL